MPRARIFAHIEHADSPLALLDLLQAWFEKQGFAGVCYVFPTANQPDHFQLFEKGLPAEWMQRYLTSDFRIIDPIPEYIMQSNTVETLHNILNRIDPTPAQQEYIEEFYKSGVTDGLGMPTRGTHNTRGFFGAAQVDPVVLEHADRALMHAVARSAHWRYDHLSSHSGVEIAHLSPRETEILNWLAAGKSNPDIATILGISLPTVATHLKRLFQKLEVNDRVSAALKGVKLGLVQR